MSNFIVGLDIGTRTIKAAVGEVSRDGKLTLVELFKMPSRGLRKGVVDDVSEVTQSLSGVLTEIKKISKAAFSNIFLGIGSSDVKVQPSTGVVAVSRADYEIYDDDVKRAIQSAQAVNIAPNRLVLHAIVKEYIVDGLRDIRDPLGMVGNRLEVNSLIIDSFVPTIKNLTKCVEILGGGVSGLILGSLADARAVLSKNQKELGIVLIDIGFGKTSICVYEENKLLHAAVFPVGAGNITNDLAIGLKIPIEIAETIKLSFGAALAREVGIRDIVELEKIDSRSKGSVSKKFIADIIEVRLAEIFEFVNNDLKHISKAQKLPGGVVLVGGGVKLPGIVELAKQELKLSTQIGIPDFSSIEIKSNDLRSKIDDPEFICAIGLLLSGYDKQMESKSINLPFLGNFRKILRYFAP